MRVRNVTSVFPLEGPVQEPIDRIPERLEMTKRHIGSEVIDYTATDVGAELRERTGGRGPGVCIESVGMEAHSDSPVHLYDQVKQQLRLQTDRPTAC
ncbi:hypothetical protein ABZ865_10245 [Streptomyces sp. NPDC047085]|uniref:hypothetical protein n=1 Tax=Streptomyces sp. NPDC047085 TaxID=3155140 RepID=UPI0033EE5C60